MLNFCTLFNENYLAKGLALYRSLLKTTPAFHLYIFAFDDITYQVLTAQNLVNATIISLNDFETPELALVKKDRSVAEYCWTCTPFTVKYSIEKFGLDHCTYLDADTYFYNDPSVLIKEGADSSVIITPHNYYPDYDQSAASGIYCVQFTTFKNDADGMKVLNWWGNACLAWCHRWYEDGKMGDQKYLDSWPYMFDKVHICRNKGAGLAPWNLLNYQFSDKAGQLQLDNEPLIFYHFHDLRSFPENLWFTGGYEMPEIITEDIYKPYINLLLQIDKELRLTYPGINALGTAATGPEELGGKYKFGIYCINLKRSFKQFFDSLFFVSKRRHYKRNYINP